ncbi:MAG: hypothetical protein WC117_09400 [Sphaerochaetaceae bacterium]
MPYSSISFFPSAKSLPDHVMQAWIQTFTALPQGIKPFHFHLDHFLINTHQITPPFLADTLISGVFSFLLSKKHTFRENS